MKRGTMSTSISEFTWFLKLNIGDEFYFRNCSYRKVSETHARDLDCGGIVPLQKRCQVLPYKRATQ